MPVMTAQRIDTSCQFNAEILAAREKPGCLGGHLTCHRSSYWRLPWLAMARNRNVHHIRDGAVLTINGAARNPYLGEVMLRKVSVLVFPPAPQKASSVQG